MHRAVAAWLLGLMAAVPLSAQEAAVSGPGPSNGPDLPLRIDPNPQSGADSEAQAALAVDGGPVEGLPWQTAWGLLGLRIIPAGVKTAPNGVLYHPNFSLDGNLNIWLWRAARVYLFLDSRFWGERPEDNVTNGRDGFMGTSKRQFDLSGGAAWNYAGHWEARFSGYSYANLNRGNSLVAPTGFDDGCLVENRYYLSQEYDRLGQTGFDVARATFLSVGYFPSKTLTGNDGQTFKPGLMLRAYLNYDLWEWRRLPVQRCHVHQ